MMNVKPMTPICIGCNKKPSELEEYIECCDIGETPDDYVRKEEGTYNRLNGHFVCSMCYIKIGCPSSPTGWRAP